MVTITEHSTEGKNMKMKDLKNHFLLLQINDSLFPIGGYSHSYGLETYIQKGIVHNSELAAEYIRKRLLYNFLYTDFLAVRLAYDAALQEDEPPAIPVLTVFCAPAWGWIGRRFCPPFSMPRPPRWSPTA